MPTKDPKDRVYARRRETVPEFRFDEPVARVFPDMIRRSVPGYGLVIQMTSVLAARYVQPHTRCYDLGCSLAASALALQRGIRVPGCRIIAVDNSAAMLARARERLVAGGDPPIELVHADLLDMELVNASMIVLNFTLQFLDPGRRLDLLTRCHRGLRRGGLLLLSEKIHCADPLRDRLHSGLHHAFKRCNGYDDLEISQKRSALENVLMPDSLERHGERLRDAGFRRAEVWFRCLNFVSLLAQR